MKKGFLVILTALTVFALAMTACGGGGGGGKNTGASLTTFSLGGDAVTLGSAISETDWTALTDLSELTTAQIATYSLNPDLDGTDIAIATTASTGAAVVFATTYNDKPETYKGGSTVKLEGGSFIVIKVTAQDGVAINYYVVAVELVGSNTTLSSISIAGGANATTISGSTNAVLTGVTTLCPVNVSNSLKDNAEITLTFGSTFRGEAQVAKIGASATISESDFGTAFDYNDPTKPKFNFVDGDKLYIKLTAENGTTVKYYGYNVLVGWDATLSDILFNNTSTWTNTATQISVDSLGTPQTDTANFPDTEAGKIQFKVTQPSPGGFYIKGAKNDPDQTVTISKDGTTWVAGDGTQRIFFAEGDSLYVKVVPQNSQATTKYYKITIALQRSVNIPYGTVTGTPDAANIGTDWDGATDWLFINRANATEGSGWLDQDVADRSHGRAKLMWNEDGVWVYVEVWEKVVSANTGDHTVSSVELFINEAYPGPYTTNAVTGSGDKNGGQYRLGANGELTGPNDANTGAFRALGKASAVKVPTGMGTYTEAINSLDSGYKVLFQAPWRFPDLYALAADKQIGIELQINATGATGTRVGVLNWNNVSSNSYSSLADYGEANLKLPAGQALKPQRPVIGTQPANVKVDVGAATIPAFTVAATSVDGGTPSYQWYQADDATAAGTAITGATSATYTPTTTDVDLTQEGDFFFYVVVTNVKDGVSSTPVPSNRVKVTVVNPDNAVYSIELVKSSHANYVAASSSNPKSGGLVFTNEGGWGNYAQVTGADLPLPATLDLSGYSRIEFVYTCFIGNTQFDTEAQYTSNNRWSLDFGPRVFSGTNASLGDFGNNASEPNPSVTNKYCTSNWNLIQVMKDGDFSGGQGRIGIWAMNKTNGAGTPATPKVDTIVVKSVRLIATSPTPLELDLSKEITTGWSGGGQGNRVPAGYDAGTNSITWTLSGGDERAAIALTEAQIEKVLDANLLKITVYGSSTGTNAKFRYYLANVTTGTDWNGTNASNNNADAAFSAVGSATGVTQEITFSDNKTKEGRCSSFLLRSSGATTENVTITRVTIEIIK